MKKAKNNYARAMVILVLFLTIVLLLDPVRYAFGLESGQIVKLSPARLRFLRIDTAQSGPGPQPRVYVYENEKQEKLGVLNGTIAAEGPFLKGAPEFLKDSHLLVRVCRPLVWSSYLFRRFSSYLITLTMIAALLWLMRRSDELPPIKTN